MSLFTLLLLALALGTDAFSLCLGVGLAGVSGAQIAMISISILAFHILMPLAGWQIGEAAGRFLGQAAGVVGALVLFYLGARMIWQSLPGGGAAAPKIVLVKDWGLLLLALSVSMDALAVGFTLGTRGTNLLLTVFTFGIVAGLMTLSGLLLGRWLGRWLGERAQLVGGVILIGIGVKLFL
ncbi:MAG: manganese efflux pump MntP family protein [Armatimonadetes bacterium]|nr:manganese efflux pump MntP family protein [Armatimonadota bacterium]